jgi:hypothetical protein
MLNIVCDWIFPLHLEFLVHVILVNMGSVTTFCGKPDFTV